MEPKAIRIIEEAKQIVPTALRQLDSGKIYGGVLEGLLRRLAKLSKKELNEIKKHFHDPQLISECEEICGEAKVAWEIMRKHEDKGLSDQQLTAIKELLERIMGLETIVERQAQRVISRGKFIRQSALASIGTFLFWEKLFGASNQLYYLIDLGNINSIFLRNVIHKEETLFGQAYVLYSSDSSDLKKLSGRLTSYVIQPTEAATLPYFLKDFSSEEIFEPTSKIKVIGGMEYTKSRDPLPPQTIG